MKRDHRASLLRAAVNEPVADPRIPLLEARIAVLTKALAALSFDQTIGSLVRMFDRRMSDVGKSVRERRELLENLAHGNCFAFTRGGEHRIIEADCQEDAWRKVKMMEGWDGIDVACQGETKPGLRDYAA